MADLLRSRIVLLVRVAALAFACSACGGGGSSPTSPLPPASNPSFAMFRVVGAGLDQSVSYGGSSNHIFCRRAAGWADLWVRFAQQSAADGSNGPHLDIDLCQLGDGGSFGPMDPQAASCGGGKTWGIWWHDQGATFVNPPGASPCALSISRVAGALSGTFSCRGLIEVSGSRSIDIVDGSFQCTEQ